MKQPSWIRLVAAAVLCLQLITRCDANVLRKLFPFGRNNGKDDRDSGSQQQQQSQRRPRRRLLEERSSSSGAVDRADVHIDAATGTVSHMVSAEEKAREAAAQSCDGQMAAALVRANQLATIAEEERDVAVTENAAAAKMIHKLEETIVQLETALAEEKTARERDVRDAAKSMQESKESAAQALQETKDRAERVLTETQETLKQEMEALTEEKSNLLKMQKELAKAEMELLRTEKDDMIASLETKLKMTSDDLQSKLQEELDKVRADRDTKLTDLKAKTEAAVASIEKDRATKLADLQDKLDRSMEALEMHEAEAARLLKTTKEEAKTYMLNQVSAVKDELFLTKKEHEKTLDAKNEKIRNLEEYTKKVMEKKSNIEQSLESSMSELDHWRSLYSNRTYCNMTYIRADLYNASVGAYYHGVDVGRRLYFESKKYAGQANQHVQKGIEFVTQLYQEQMKKHWPTVKPHFDEHVVGNYRKHVEPHVQKHVHPKMKQLSTWFRQEFIPLAENFSKKGQKQYAKFIALYGEQCNATLKQFRKACRNNDFLKEHPPPKSLMTMWGDSCSHPKESLELAFQGLLLLLGLLFYRRILRLVVWMLSWVASLILILTPLGLVISRRELFSKKNAPPTTQAPSDGTSKQQKRQPVPDRAPSSKNSNGVTSRSKRDGAATKKTT